MPKYWSFSFSISPSNEYSGLISFRIDCMISLLSNGWTLKSLLQHHSSKASICWCSAFFIVQLSCIYMMYHKRRGAFHALFSLKSQCICCSDGVCFFSQGKLWVKRNLCTGICLWYEIRGFFVEVIYLLENWKLTKYSTI